MTCEHQFHTIQQTNRIPNMPDILPGGVAHYEYGAMVGCSLCGEIRTVWENGDIDIKVKHDKASDTKD